MVLYHAIPSPSFVKAVGLTTPLLQGYGGGSAMLATTFINALNFSIFLLIHFLHGNAGITGCGGDSFTQAS